MFKKFIDTVPSSPILDTDDLVDMSSRGPRENFAEVRPQVEAFTRASLASRALSNDPLERLQAQAEFSEIIRPILEAKGINLD